MLIPNYDNLINNNNFKQLYNYMPSKSFRMWICGPSGSGKKNALVHMLLKPLIYFDKVYLVYFKIVYLMSHNHSIVF